jgi:hypothetical protein
MCSATSRAHCTFLIVMIHACPGCPDRKTGIGTPRIRPHPQIDPHFVREKERERYCRLFIHGTQLTYLCTSIHRETGIAWMALALHFVPALVFPQDFHFFLHTSRPKTQPIPISSFLLNLALSHPRNPESYLFSLNLSFIFTITYISFLPLWVTCSSIFISTSSRLLASRYPYIYLPHYPTLYHNEFIQPHQSNPPLTIHPHT